MSKVKRYDVGGYGGGMIEAEDGIWYHEDDYAALEAECVRLREALEVIVDNSEDRSAVDYAKGALSSCGAAK